MSERYPPILHALIRYYGSEPEEREVLLAHPLVRLDTPDRCAEAAALCRQLAAGPTTPEGWHAAAEWWEQQSQQAPGPHGAARARAARRWRRVR